MYSFAKPEEIIEAWRVDYNAARPHGSLGNKTPREFVQGPSTNHVRLYPRPSPAQGRSESAQKTETAQLLTPQGLPMVGARGLEPLTPTVSM
jgi:hypothetical protein